MEKESIFISFAGDETRKVGEEINSLIKSIYVDKNVEAWISSQKITAGTFKTQIMNAAMNSKIAIIIPSKENYGSADWLIFEAGVLALATAQNNGSLIPYLFCRNRALELESPFFDLHNMEYQRSLGGSNKKELITLFKSINEYLSPDNRVKERDIEIKINDQWKDIELTLEAIADRMYDPNIAGKGIYALDSQKNHPISMLALETEDQNYLRLVNDFVAKTPRELENKFEQLLRTNIPSNWKVRDKIDKEANGTRVVVNGTRFSTFVVFTDGKRIVLFDRDKDKPNTTVTNDRFDVFGSVQFENRSILKKIKSQEFLDAKIKKIEEISGAAIEDNRDKQGADKETAVMFGICVYLSPEDLDLAKNNATKDEIAIIPVSVVLSTYKEAMLTSKTALSLQHIAQKND